MIRLSDDVKNAGFWMGNKLCISWFPKKFFLPLRMCKKKSIIIEGLLRAEKTALKEDSQIFLFRLSLSAKNDRSNDFVIKKWL